MAILITGGTGSLGSYLARKMIIEGFKNIILFDLKPNYKIIKEIVNQVYVEEGNINYWPDLIKIVNKYKIREIIHLVAGLSTKIKENPYFGFKVNLEGTVNILEIARLYNIKKVIFTSSISTFGLDVDEPVKENYCQRPTNLYGITKVASELWGLYYYREYGCDFRALRFPRLVNPGRLKEGIAAYPSLMIERAIRGQAYEVEVDQDYQIPIIYIKDAVNSLLLLNKKTVVETRVYNINGLLPTAKEIVEAIKKCVPNALLDFSNNPIKSHLAIPLKYDDAKAREELGWKLEYSLEKMINDFNKEINK